MKRSKILGLALIVAVLATMALLGGCYPTSTEEGGSSTTSTIYMIVFLVLIFAMFYFLMIRPQRKRQQTQKKMMQDLNKGDKIVTIGGIYGVIESVTEDSFVIKVESGATIRMARHAIAAKRNQ